MKPPNHQQHQLLRSQRRQQKRVEALQRRRQHLPVTTGESFLKVASVKDRMDGGALNISGDFATSRRKASASLESTSASSAEQRGHIINVNTDKGLQKNSHTSHVKRHSWNSSLVRVVYLMP